MNTSPQERTTSRFVGAFFVDQPFARLGPNDVAAQRVLERLAASGVTSLLIESHLCSERLIRMAHGIDLSVMGVFCCFGKSDLCRRSFAERADLRPVNRAGTRWPARSSRPMVVPTSAEYNDRLAIELSRFVADVPVDGLVLDFLRWPLHWERSLRSLTYQNDLTSFDRLSLAQFESSGFAVEPPAGRQPVPVSDPARDEAWRSFKIEVISTLAREFAGLVREDRGGGFPMGTTLVPAPADVVGQSVGDLVELFDFLFPMMYHAVLRRDRRWVLDALDDLYGACSGQVVPVVQVETDRASAAGVDWGTTVSEDEWRHLLSEAISWGRSSPRIAVFDGSGIVQGGRGDALRDVLAGAQ